MRMPTGIVLLVLVPGLAGCGSSSTPLAPSPVPQAAPLVPQATPPPPISLVAFTDLATGFSTFDVRDAQEQIVQFNTASELIWTATGTRFAEYFAGGNFIAYHHRADVLFQIRFGRRDGEQRAYLTLTDNALHGDAPTILDLSVDGRGDLIITETGVRVPGT